MKNDEILFREDEIQRIFVLILVFFLLVLVIHFKSFENDFYHHLLMASHTF